MDKAIILMFEALMGSIILAATIALLIIVPWPLTLLAIFPAVGTVMIGMIMFDIARH